MTSTADSFPVEARVVLHGLVKSPTLNGKTGCVKSALTNGRQHVYIDEDSKSVALKPANLKYEGKDIETLSAKELKAILRSKLVPKNEISGIDKAELQTKVSEFASSPEEVAELLYKATEPKPKRAAGAGAAVNPSQAADQLGNMSPEQLLQQARMMRTMPPSTIRKMNPQLANMSDEQIKMAADQMEMMANNPQMVKMASEQMKNMSPEDVQRMQNQMNNNGSATSRTPAATSSNTAARAATTTPSTNTGQAQQAANMMANMTPEQLKQQADMLKTMDPDAVRRMNPQLAHMSDDQIRMAATQFEMMANNPSMMKMAMDQMKNLSPEQIAAMQNSGGAPPSQQTMDQMGADPAKMLESMDKTQLKQMLNTLKDNPEMMKQFATMSGLGEEQLAQGVRMFSEMEDDKLDAALGMMKKVQKARGVWTQVDAKVGGHLMKIVIVVAILLVGWFVKWMFFSAGGGNVDVNDIVTETHVPDVPQINVDVAVEDEFAGDEFADEF